MGDVPSDRRRAERVPVNADFEGFGDAIYVSNLSEYGLFVHTMDFVDIGTEIDLQFSIVLDDPVVLRGKGIVVRHQDDPTGMGIEFNELEPEMILRINDIIMRERPKDLGEPVPPASGDPASDTVVGSVLPTRDLKMSPVGNKAASSDDEEAAQTLVNLKPIDLEIIEDGELPEDDGGPVAPKGGGR